MAYEVTHSEIIFQGKIFGVRIDQLQIPSGRNTRVDMVTHEGAVALIPVDDQDRIWFVRQYRHPANKILLELPAGTLEPGEKPEACAVRECREEIGLSPAHLVYLGGVYPSPGYSTEFIHFYLAQDLTPSPLAPDKDEDLEIECLTWDDVHELTTRQELRDAKTLVGIHLASIHLGKKISTA